VAVFVLHPTAAKSKNPINATDTKRDVSPDCEVSKRKIANSSSAQYKNVSPSLDRSDERFWMNDPVVGRKTVRVEALVVPIGVTAIGENEHTAPTGSPEGQVSETEFEKEP
jgi:hypothetical protein